MIAKSRIIRNAFYLQLAAYILSELTQMIGNVIDGVIIGRCLGVDSMAAFGIISPLMVAFALFGTIIATGSRNFFTRLVGEGRIKDAQGIFSLSLLFSVGLSAFFMIFVLLFSEQIAGALGASGSAAYLLPKARAYLIGISIGLPAINAMKILCYYLPIDNDRQLPVNASLVLAVTNVVLDVLVAFVLHGDIFGMGVATSISYYMAVAVLLLHFRKKDVILKLSVQNIRWREIPGIIAQGIPIGVCQIGYMVRVAFMNRLLAAVASSQAIAAYSVYQQADNILCCLTIGMADTVAVLAGILFGEEDRPRMKRLLFTSVQATLVITLGVSVLTFIAAPGFASLYISGDAEALAYSIKAVRAYAVGMPLYGLSLIYFNYFQGIGRNRLSSVAGFLSESGFLMLSAGVLSNWFYADAVWYAFVATQILMYAFYGILIAIESRRNGTRSMMLWDRVLLLSATFDVQEDARIDLSITEVKEMKELSEAVWDFCLAHGCDIRRTYHMSLAVEEMAGNVLQHGFPHDKRIHSIEVRVLKKGDDYILRIRDDCFIFDPQKQLELYSEDDPMHHLGLRMIVGTAKEFQYTCVLKLNNLRVRV